MSHLLPTNCVEHEFLLCEAIIKAMLLLENCDYSNSVELLMKVRDQFSDHILDSDDKYSEAYDNAVTLLHRITEQNR